MSKEPSTPNAAPLQAGDLVEPKEAAKLLATNERTLANWRSAKKGPRFVRVGQRMIRYRRSDLAKFLAEFLCADDGKEAA